MRAEVEDVWADWKTAVTLTAGQLEEWLETDERRSVGQKDQGGESTGHRHLEQRPSGDVEDTRWRCSLMNRGHDPLR